MEFCDYLWPSFDILFLLNIIVVVENLSLWKKCFESSYSISLVSCVEIMYHLIFNLLWCLVSRFRSNSTTFYYPHVFYDCTTITWFSIYDDILILNRIPIMSS
jgi:hypothetical protein